ncbi:sulfate ABC transporter permease subunit CysT [Acetobacterium sp.]|uniref:sulfate ABC transporter permease subunit CysT n=1 Tax=Acetobacterium sp. TaxID=1872094 RepID=UPI002F4273D3
MIGLKKKKRVIPGFGISMGITMTFLSLIVLIPMVSIVITSSKMDITQFLQIITDPRIVAGFRVSLISALIAALINCAFGVLIAWVLVRYDFPMKRVVDGIIELPFALPTAVAGIALTALYSNNGWIGGFFAQFGIAISYTQTGIILAMIFVGIPFVVRSIQPVLEKLDPKYEEAASILGAGRGTIFFRVIFPEIMPAMLTGFGLAFARAVGEYGSVIFIAGNTPFKTEIVPLLIMSQLEQFNYEAATAIALVMLIISFAILFFINSIQVYASKFSKG